MWRNLILLEQELKMPAQYGKYILCKHRSWYTDNSQCMIRCCGSIPLLTVYVTLKK